MYMLRNSSSARLSALQYIHAQASPTENASPSTHNCTLNNVLNLALFCVGFSEFVPVLNSVY